MQIIDGIPIYGDPIDPGALAQIQLCRRTANHAALMADHHKGYSVPIGGVLGYFDSISPSGVGFDIACGNKAVLTDADPIDVQTNIQRIMDDIVSNVSFGIGRKNKTEVDHPLFSDDQAWSLKEVKKLKQMARNQLGTVGSGNHYVDIFIDELKRVWIGVHFGSRGLGHKIATFFLKAAGAKDGMDVEPCLLSTNSDLGSDYLTSMHLAGRYAYAGRDWVCEKVSQILGANILEEIHNHHNFAWHEYIYGKKLYVIRKGATPCWPGQKSFVGGTMGEDSVILEGIANEDSKHTLFSTIHGAGRVMSRTQARGKTRRKKIWQCGSRDCNKVFSREVLNSSPSGESPKCPNCESKCHKWTVEEQISQGKITPEQMNHWLKDVNVCLRGGGLDEAPQAYKRLKEVLTHHQNSVKILHVLKPIGVAMAGPHEFDPYKD